jgi:hypothetical protein
VTGSQHPIPALMAGIGRASRGTRRVAPGSEPVKGAPSGPPAAGPVGPPLTEPVPSAEGHQSPAGWSLPEPGQHEFFERQPRYEGTTHPQASFSGDGWGLAHDEDWRFHACSVHSRIRPAPNA